MIDVNLHLVKRRSCCIGTVDARAHGIIVGSIVWIPCFMRSRFIRQWGSIIGLLAILMTALAPAISQGMQAMQAQAAPGQTDDYVTAYCSATAKSSAHVTLPSRLANHASTSAHGPLSACGYCDFVAHFPAATPSVASRSFSVSAYSPLYHGDAYSIEPYAPVVAAQPRAPPSHAA